MTVLILSDIHANLEALEAVLDHVPGYDDVWFLGDIVGYGPDPNACIERVRALEPSQWLAGNHDWAAVGRMETDDFNPEARRAAHWTAEALSEAALALLRGLEPRVEGAAPGVTLVHGSPRRPVWEYVLDASVAMESFEHFETALCLFGHTHVPALYEEGVDGALRHPIAYDRPLDLSAGRWLANPGSVGQPRDGDPRSSYALFDPERKALSVHRVAYDIAAVQEKILKAGLPPRLAARLDHGW